MEEGVELMEVERLSTGKLDSNGKEIKQGDITKIGGLYEQVCFGEYKLDGYEYSTIGFYNKSEYGISPFFSDTANIHEVIGNVYKNPELLIEE